jgi:aspartyl-tRNA synthetase
MKLKRTHYCGELSAKNIGKTVCLNGWVDRWRDHGGITFIDLRDREGIAQVVFDPSHKNFAEASTLRQEFVISISGVVRERPSGMQNKNIPTGQIEILVDNFELLNKAAPLPFSLHDDSPSMGEVDEMLRLQYRYLDLRKENLQKNLKIRHEFLKSAREFYFHHLFSGRPVVLDSTGCDSNYYGYRPIHAAAIDAYRERNLPRILAEERAAG